MQTSLKRTFFISIGFLFCSGLVYILMDTFFQVQGSFGQAPRPSQIWFLRFHSISSLWFLFLFGMIYAKHIGPKLRFKKNRFSGLVFLGALVILCLTVPGLFYLTNETAKQWTAALHTYLGIALVLPFLAHSVFQKG